MDEEHIWIPPLRLADVSLYEERDRTCDGRFESLNEDAEAAQHIARAIDTYLRYQRTRKATPSTIESYGRYLRRIFPEMPGRIAAPDFDR